MYPYLDEDEEIYEMLSWDLPGIRKSTNSFKCGTGDAPSGLAQRYKHPPLQVVVRKTGER